MDTYNAVETACVVTGNAPRIGEITLQNFSIRKAFVVKDAGGRVFRLKICALDVVKKGNALALSRTQCVELGEEGEPPIRFWYAWGEYEGEGSNLRLA